MDFVPRPVPPTVSPPSPSPLQSRSLSPSVSELVIRLFWDVENCPPPKSAEQARHFIKSVKAAVYEAAVTPFAGRLPPDAVSFRMDAVVGGNDLVIYGADFAKVCQQSDVRVTPVYRKGILACASCLC